MKSLLWKDYRLNRLLLIFGLVVCVGPWIIAIARVNYLFWFSGDALSSLEFWISTCGLSLGLSLFTFAMLGGNAIAAERADRSAEFLAYIPVSRWSVIASKSCIAFAAGAAIWAINLFILFIIASSVGHIFSIPETASRTREMLGIFGAVSVLLFGSGWFWSSILAGHGLATGMSFFNLAVVSLGLIGIDYLCDGGGNMIENWFVPVCLVVGIGGYLTGCAYYLHRLEP